MDSNRNFWILTNYLETQVPIVEAVVRAYATDEDDALIRRVARLILFSRGITISAAPVRAFEDRYPEIRPTVAYYMDKVAHLRELMGDKMDLANLWAHLAQAQRDGLLSIGPET